METKKPLLLVIIVLLVVLFFGQIFLKADNYKKPEINKLAVVNWVR